MLRLAAVYGPHMKGNYPRLVRAIARGRFLRIGDGANRRTLIHEKDAARAALLAAEHPEAGGNIFNVTDGAVHTLNEILAAIAAASGRRVPRWSVPAGLARAGLGIWETVAQPFGSTLSSPPKGQAVLHRLESLCHLPVGPKSTWGRASVDKFTEDLAVSGEKFQRELGFRAEVDLAAGWRNALFGWEGKNIG